MENIASQVVRSSFWRKEDSPLPTHTYNFSQEGFSSKLLPHVVDSINQKEEEYKEKAVIQLIFKDSELVDSAVRQLGPLNSSNQIQLWLQTNEITAVGCSYISAFSWTRQLTLLKLSKNKISDKGCLYLSEGDFPQLKKLDIDNCYIGDEGCFHLGRLKARELRRLCLYNNKFGPKGCKGFSKGDWPRLQSLGVGNQVTEKGVAHLTKATWVQLKDFVLNELVLGDRGCSWLVRANFKNVTSLKLGGYLIDADSNGIREKGCEHICKMESVKLHEFTLYNWGSQHKNKIGKAGEKWFKARITGRLIQ